MAVIKRSLSLRAKVISLIIFIIAVVLFASTSLSLWMSEELLEEGLKENAMELARELAGGIWSQADLEDVPTLNREIKDIMALRPLVRRIDVFARATNGLILVASSSGTGASPGILTSPPQEVTAKLARGRRGRLWEVIAPIYLGDEVGGALRLNVSLKKTDELAERSRLQFLLVMGVGVVLIVALLSAFFHRAVDRPIRELVWTMERAEAGELSARVRGRQRDEIGQLGERLNHMLGRIEESYRQNLELLQKINTFNEELKKKVLVATQDLERRNEDLRRANEQLIDTQLQLRQSERLAMVGEMAATVAHEIGTPLNSISGHVQLLLQDSAVDPPTTSRLKIIEGQIVRTVEILQGIMNLSRLPDRALKALDVNALLQEIFDLTSPGLALKNVTIKTRFGQDLPVVLGDVHQLQQVFLNLITNALDAMPDGGELTVETGLDESYAGEQGFHSVRMGFTDTGCGIDPEDQKRIFEPFFTTKDLGKGTGLGLAVCQRIVKAHSGNITVKSQVGKGTTFIILLPVETQGV
jgi:signal transduction histidine kinase